MTKKQTITLLSILWSAALSAQTIYFSGDTNDVVRPTAGGIVLSGGAGEVDEAMKWFLERSGGGDIVVLRASGADGYQSYLFEELGVEVNSVQTILTSTAQEALNPMIAHQIRHAEGIWIAGGDQSRYVNFWKNTAIEDALKYAIHVRKVPIGGISAGMAVLGDAYFTAQNGTVMSGEALANPFDTKVALGYSDFINHPHLEGVITDTHFNDPDRKGRTTVFLARLYEAYGLRGKAIACDELVAVCIDSQGVAKVYGPADSPAYAYFVQTNCVAPMGPELLTAGQPLTWKRSNAALKTCKIQGNTSGSSTFDINDWRTATGAYQWQNWWVNAGGLFNLASTTTPPDCAVATTLPTLQTKIAPNPTSGTITIELTPEVLPVAAEVFDTTGRSLMTQNLTEVFSTLKLPDSAPPIVYLTLRSPRGTLAQKIVIRD
jgi:cyanophycinase-like exopeptidase